MYENSTFFELFYKIYSYFHILYKSFTIWEQIVDFILKCEYFMLYFIFDFVLFIEYKL